MNKDIKPEALKAVKVFYIDPKWDLGWFNTSNDMRRELLNICMNNLDNTYGPEVSEIMFRTSSLTARQQYQIGQVLKKYLNLNMKYWLELPAALTCSNTRHIIARAHEFPDCLCTKTLTPFGDGFDVYPYEIRFRLDNHNKYIIRMAFIKEESTDA